MDDKKQIGSRKETEMLVELYDMISSPDGSENWAETARWIKYEEDIEGVDKHWGRPHVAYLAFHSLMQLRQCFAKGVVLLDSPACDMMSVVDQLASSMAMQYDIDPASANAMLGTLRMHKTRKFPSRRFSRRSLFGSQRRSMSKSRKASSVVSVDIGHNNPAGPNSQDPDGIGERKRTPSRRLSWTNFGLEMASVDDTNVDEDHVLCQVYAGVMPNLSGLRFAMVRLSEEVQLPDLMNASLPLRFLFVIVGPPLADVDYHELGRAVATLMADARFKTLAYSATSRDAFLKGIDQFLDFSVVIPPGDIDHTDLLNADDVQKALNNRKQIAQSRETRCKEIQNGKKKDDFERRIVPTGKYEGRVDHVKDSLRRTGRIFGGLVDDIKYRAPYYWADFKDSLNFKVITSTLFMFFANFASAVAFGEVMEEKTDGYMGATEMLMAHAICGVVWGFIACQPLCIQAAVGPFLVFEASLYSFCATQDIDFLAVRFWTGLWTFVMMIITAAVEGSFLMRYLTRFTEDIFTSLIALIFIWEALKFLYKEVSLHPIYSLAAYCRYFIEVYHKISEEASEGDKANETVLEFWNETLLEYNHNATESPGEGARIENQPNTALLSFILVIFTFALTFTLKRLGTSAFFGRTIRKTLSDFGVPLSVFIVILIYQLCFRDTHIRHVEASASFSLTNSSLRNWVINPLGGTNGKELPIWAIFGSIVPAFLVGILVFAEVEIIELLLAKPERGLVRPHGFHWDLIVCGGMVFVCSIFGMPWMCPGAVQSLSHSSSLMVMKRTAPGAAPQLDYVVEQRVSCMLVGLLHGAAAFAGVALVFIPVPVLFGLFLFLGVMGLMNIQFVSRLILLFIPRKYFPNFPYCQEVSFWRMHLFTLIQLLCFAALWAVNMLNSVALAFPFILTLIAVFRMFAMGRIFTKSELQALDGKPESKPPPPPIEDTESNEKHGKIIL